METTDCQYQNPLLRITLTEETDNFDSHDEIFREENHLSPEKCCCFNVLVHNEEDLCAQRILNMRPAVVNNPYQKRNNAFPSYHPVNNERNNVNVFNQKIMSAKLLRFKQMQNQIAELAQKLNELMSENRMLKTLQKRQDNAIKRFEGSKEQLPQLIRSHNEEVRVLSTKFKQLKLSHRDLENKLKQRDTELMNLREQHKHLLQLSRDKHLCEREKLTKKLETLEILFKEQETKVLNLNKKLGLQEKHFRHQLQTEVSKHKETQGRLDNALEIIENLKMALEMKEKGMLSSFTKKSDANFIRKTKSSLSPSRATLKSQAVTTTSETSMDTFPAYVESPYCQVSGSNEQMDEGESELEAHKRLELDAENTLDTLQEKPPVQNVLKEGSELKQKNSTTKPKFLNTTKCKSRSMNGNSSIEDILACDHTSKDSLKISSNSTPKKHMEKELEAKNKRSMSEPIISTPPLTSSENIREHMSKFMKARSNSSDLNSSDSDEAVTAFHGCEANRPNFGNTVSDFHEEMEKEIQDMMNKCSVRIQDEMLYKRNMESRRQQTDGGLKDSKTKAEKDIEEMLDRACKGILSDCSDSKPEVKSCETNEIDELVKLSWDELQVKVGPIKEDVMKKIENNFSKNVTLDENEKEDLLNALKLIDRETQLLEGDLANDGVDKLKLYSDDKLKNNGNKGNCSKRKSKDDMMKKIFGQDSDHLLANVEN